MATGVVLAMIGVAACSSSEDGAEYTGPRALTNDLSATIELVMDEKRSSLAGDCSSQVSAMAVTAVEDEHSLLTVHVFYPGPDSSTPVQTFINVYEPRYAYVDEITRVDVSSDGLTGSVEGAGLLYEDSTTSPAEVSITWSCERR